MATKPIKKPKKNIYPKMAPKVIRAQVARYKATENPIFLIPILLAKAKCKEASDWLRISLAQILGLAYGSTKARKRSVAEAMGIKPEHIKSIHVDYRAALIRSSTERFRPKKEVRGRAEHETLEDAVNILVDGNPGVHGPVIDGISKSTVMRIAKTKRS